MPRLFLEDDRAGSDDEYYESSDDEDDASYRNSPIPDDTNSKWLKCQYVNIASMELYW